MSIDKQLESFIIALNDNTAAVKDLTAAISGSQKKSEVSNNPAEKVSKADGKEGPQDPSPSMKAGLGEKAQEPVRAGAPEQKAPEAAPEKPQEVKKEASESVDLGSEKLERGRLCSTLFGSLKSKLGAKAAKEKVQELIDSFCGAEGSTAADSVTHERHAEFVSYIKKHIDEAQNA